MSLFISIKGMQSKVSASIANAEQEVPGHIVRSITQIAERILREAFQSVPFVAGVFSSNAWVCKMDLACQICIDDDSWRIALYCFAQYSTSHNTKPYWHNTVQSWQLIGTILAPRLHNLGTSLAQSWHLVQHLCTTLHNTEPCRQPITICIHCCVQLQAGRHLPPPPRQWEWHQDRSG